MMTFQDTQILCNSQTLSKSARVQLSTSIILLLHKQKLQDILHIVIQKMTHWIDNIGLCYCQTLGLYAFAFHISSFLNGVTSNYVKTSKI